MSKAITQICLIQMEHPLTFTISLPVTVIVIVLLLSAKQSNFILNAFTVD